MKLTRTIRRAALLLAALALMPALSAVTANAATSRAATTQAAASSATGWIRLAHLAPDTPPVDVYLYPFGNQKARVVLHHVAYGDISAYQAVPVGYYSVAMRPAGDAYTAAALGPSTSLRLHVVRDDLTTPPGKALVRVIQASLKQRVVTVRWDGKVVAGKLSFPAVTSYQAVAPGKETVSVAGDAPSVITLAAGSVHTIVVLDGAKGLEIANLEDSSGSSRLPKGAPQTGFGGTAPHGPGSPLPWLAVIAAGALLALGGGLGLRREHSHDRRSRCW